MNAYASYYKNIGIGGCFGNGRGDSYTDRIQQPHYF